VKESKQMLLAIDIGNSNIAVGIFENSWIEHWRIYTEAKRTADEYGILLQNLFLKADIDTTSIREIVISSVVPELAPVFETAVRDLCDVEPFLVRPGIQTNLNPDSIPGEMGADLIANAAAAHDKFPSSPCMIIDFGTALTFTTVSAAGDVLGVAIAPGVGSALGALSSNTAQLPHVDIKIPESVLGRNTIHSIQAGVVFGYTGLVKSLIDETEKEIGESLQVIATGGFSHVIAPKMPRIDAFEPWHTLDGLRLLYHINQ
jgi:type III pantothenate kinase